MSAQLIHSTSAFVLEAPSTQAERLFSDKQNAPMIADVLILGLDGVLDLIRQMSSDEQPHWLEYIFGGIAYAEVVKAMPDADDDVVDAHERTRFAELLNAHGFDLYARILVEAPQVWANLV